jgi:hypothetical protein
MNVFLLSNQEKAGQGFTHRIELTHADLTETATNTAQNIPIFTVTAGMLVTKAAMVLKTAFTDASDAAFNTTPLIVGDDGNDDRFIVSTELNSNGTEVLYAAPASTTDYVYVADNTIDAIFGSMSAKALNDIDGGEVHIFLHIIDLPNIS